MSKNDKVNGCAQNTVHTHERTRTRTRIRTQRASRIDLATLQCARTAVCCPPYGARPNALGQDIRICAESTKFYMYLIYVASQLTRKRPASVCVVCVWAHTSGIFRANVLASKQIIAYTSVVVLTSEFSFFYACASFPFSACAWDLKYFFSKSFDLKIQHKFSKYLLQSVFNFLSLSPYLSISISGVDKASFLLISIIESIMPDLMN